VKGRAEEALGEAEHVGALGTAALLRLQHNVGSTSRSNRCRNFSRAARMRAVRSSVRLHEISAAIRC
jgi:hypothetical protein